LSETSDKTGRIRLVVLTIKNELTAVSCANGSKKQNQKQAAAREEQTLNNPVDQEAKRPCEGHARGGMRF